MLNSIVKSKSCAVACLSPTQPTKQMPKARYKTDKMLLERHPEHKELLEKMIKQHEKDIIAYVTSERFEYALEHLNL